MHPALRRADDGRPAARLATAVSYIVNPLILPAVEFGLVLLHFGAGASEIRSVVLVTLVFFMMVPLAYLTVLVRRGHVETLEVRRRGARTRPFVVAILSYLVGCVVMAQVVETAGPLVLVLASVYPISTVLVALINLRWKISVHVSNIAGFLTALVFVAWMPWSIATTGVLNVVSIAPLLALLPLLMWARVRTGAHTPAQVVGGALFGFGMTMGLLHAAAGVVFSV